MIRVRVFHSLYHLIRFESCLCSTRRGVTTVQCESFGRLAFCFEGFFKLDSKIIKSLSSIYWNGFCGERDNGAHRS